MKTDNLLRETNVRRLLFYQIESLIDEYSEGSVKNTTLFRVIGHFFIYKYKLCDEPDELLKLYLEKAILEIDSNFEGDFYQLGIKLSRVYENFIKLGTLETIDEKSFEDFLTNFKNTDEFIKVLVFLMDGVRELTSKEVWESKRDSLLRGFTTISTLYVDEDIKDFQQKKIQKCYPVNTVFFKSGFHKHLSTVKMLGYEIIRFIAGILLIDKLPYFLTLFVLVIGYALTFTIDQYKNRPIIDYIATEKIIEPSTLDTLKLFSEYPMTVNQVMEHLEQKSGAKLYLHTLDFTNVSLSKSVKNLNISYTEGFFYMAFSRNQGANPPELEEDANCRRIDHSVKVVKMPPSSSFKSFLLTDRANPPLIKIFASDDFIVVKESKLTKLLKNPFDSLKLFLSVSITGFIVYLLLSTALKIYLK